MQVLVFKAKEGLILALPMLEVTALVTFKEEHLHPVFNLCGPHTELEGQAEDARFGGPSKLLVLGMRITGGHRHGRGTLHLHALVVVLVEDQEGAAVWSRRKQLQQKCFYDPVALVHSTHEGIACVRCTYLCLQ